MKEKAINLLKWSEKYTKTDMLYLFKGGFWLTLGQFVSSCVALATSIAFANLLPQETYGIYRYILSITSILSITTLTGMDSAVTQAVARGYDNSINIGLKAKMKWGTLGTLSSIIVATYYFINGNNILSLSFLIVSVFMPFYESFDIYNSLLFGKKLFSIQTLYSVIRKVISLVVIVGILFINTNIHVIVITYFLLITIPAGIFLFKTLKNKENNQADPDIVAYGKHLSVIGIIGIVATELDRILIFQHIGAVELAVYTLALAPTDQIKGFMKSINSLALPKFSIQNGDNIKRVVLDKTKILTVITSILIFIYVLIAPLFFKIFFPKYMASVIYSQILAISLIGAVVSSFLYTILESQKAKKQLYQFNTYSNITSILLLIPLIYYFGIIGAVISRLISRSVTAIISYKLVRDIV